jgi:hypothetical protein
MVYGGTGQKGSRIDPRSGRVQQEDMLRSRQGGRPPWTRFAWLGLAVVVLVVVVVLIAATRDGDSTSPTSTGDQGGSASVGLLNCEPGVIDTQQVDGNGRTPRDIMRDLESSVVMVAQDQASSTKWWGFDSNERVVAGLIEGESPGQYQMLTCTG